MAQVKGTRYSDAMANWRIRGVGAGGLTGSIFLFTGILQTFSINLLEYDGLEGRIYEHEHLGFSRLATEQHLARIVELSPKPWTFEFFGR